MFPGETLPFFRARFRSNGTEVGGRPWPWGTQPQSAADVDRQDATGNLDHFGHLVGGLEHEFYFSIQLGIIIPTDFHIFQRGWNHQPVIRFFVLNGI
jgi:hypothetical protein